MYTGIDSQLKQRMDSFRGNPEALMQQYQQSQQLLDLLALQKLKSEKEAAAREMAMAMQQQPQTIKDQREQEVMGLTQNEVAQQLGIAAPMQQQKAQQQQVMQAMQGQGAQGGPDPRMSGIASAMPSGPSMASGGIVSFAGGGQAEVDKLLNEALERGATPEEMELLSRRRIPTRDGEKGGNVPYGAEMELPFDSMLAENRKVAEEDSSFATDAANYLTSEGLEKAKTLGKPFIDWVKNNKMDAISMGLMLVPVVGPAASLGARALMGTRAAAGAAPRALGGLAGLIKNNPRKSSFMAGTGLQVLPDGSESPEGASQIALNQPKAEAAQPPLQAASNPTAMDTRQMLNDAMVTAGKPAPTPPAAPTSPAPAATPQGEAPQGLEAILQEAIKKQTQATPEQIAKQMGYTDEERARLNEGMDPKSLAWDRFKKFALGASTGATNLSSLTRGSAAAMGEEDAQRRRIAEIIEAERKNRAAGVTEAGLLNRQGLGSGVQLFTAQEAQAARIAYQQAVAAGRKEEAEAKRLDEIRERVQTREFKLINQMQSGNEKERKEALQQIEAIIAYEMQASGIPYKSPLNQGGVPGFSNSRTQ